MPIEKRPLLERLTSRVRVEDSGCWVWTGSTRKGYGKISVDGKSEQAHRASYEAHVGAIPAGLTIDHLCRNKACINPAHLEPVTNQENLRRAQPFRVLKDHCVHGHPLSGENLMLQQKKRGIERVCRECNLTALRKWRAKTADKRAAAFKPKPKPEHCRKGHPFTEVRHGPNGKEWRQCAECRREREVRRNSVVREARAADPKPRIAKTHCIRGHELSGDNVSVHVYGAKVMRQCVACRRGYQLAAKEARAAAKAARKEAKRLAKARAVER